MDNKEITVLIVGAGPTGLTAALLLAQQGISTLLVEKRVSTSIHPRARGLNIRTMEIFRSVGLEEKIKSAGAQLALSRYMLFVESLAGKEIRRIPDDELMASPELTAIYSPAYNSQCAQDALEPLLLQAAQNMGAIVKFNTELVSFVQDNEGVTALLRDNTTGLESTLRCSYLIAADGVSSAVRTALGIERQGIGVSDLGTDRPGPLGYYVNVYFKSDLSELVKDRWFGICFIENPAFDGLILPVNNSDRWLLNISYSPDKGESPVDFTPQRCQELVKEAIGSQKYPVEILSILPWEAAARVVDRMQVGRVFLAGDAAHQMPPAGGFGLNTGVQDAHNMAWKIALVLKGQAGTGLLETYEAERLPVARMVVNQAVRELTAPTPDTLVRPEWGEEGESEGGGWSGEGGPPPGETDLLGQLVVSLAYHYSSKAVIGAVGLEPEPGKLDLTGTPGTRAPHLWLERQGERLSTLDLFGKGFVLLTGSEGNEWVKTAGKVAGTLNLKLDVYQIGEGKDLADIAGNWAKVYGVTPAGAVLVRPDGFVGWRISSLAKLSEQELEKAITQLLGRKTAN